MRLAILADVHGNLEAFRACLDHARGRGAERLVLLGDLVGYGADPGAVVDLAMAEVAAGALALLGNHDEAAAGTRPTGMTALAAEAMAWTRRCLTPVQKAFLAGLPLTAEAEGCLFVHAEGPPPPAGATSPMPRSAAQHGGDPRPCDHLRPCPPPRPLQPRRHRQADRLPPVPGAPVPLLHGRRWLAVLGAVGQPRDGNPAACYLTLDTDRRPPPGSACPTTSPRRRPRSAPPACRTTSPNASSTGDDGVIRPGRAIDGFEVGEVLHEGGMAFLFRVTRPGTDMPMLMKVPRLPEGEDPAAIVSFEMEQLIMPRLSGVHVPRFIAMRGFEAEPYIVMERIPGAPLSQRLRQLPLRAGKVAEIGAAVADALDALHHQHVVHLDVKPANILFREDGAAVLIDYGLAHHEQLPDLMAEEFRLPYGTAPYMAPEQVLCIRNDPRSDIFALGAMSTSSPPASCPSGEPHTSRA